MQIHKRFLRTLAEQGIINMKSDYYTDSEKEFVDWLESERAKLEAGEDIEPPWIQGNGVPPWSGSWRQGRGDFWLQEIWGPFWSGLSNDEREKYLERWQPPDDEWYEYITARWWVDSPTDLNK